MAATTKPVTKKLINTPESCVDDNLRGVVAIYPQLHLHPKHRVVTVQMKKDTKRVAVLGGGGSGHEPFAAGMLGEGMLDGAVAGGVFASPPTGNVLYAIEQLHKYNSGGVLVILGNYTGDRLNFGKAIEKAKLAGIKVEGVIVGEDVATAHNKSGGRSMCGEVFYFKLCGAMASLGYDLETICNLVRATDDKVMATLGFCLSPCSLPGQPPLFEIADDEMELGAGVHGEAGINKVKIATAAESVEMILEKIIAHLKLTAGASVAVMLDNLGGTSIMEMNILSAETKTYLEKHGIQVQRIYTGHMKTSLEMHGFQICLINLVKEHGELLLRLLDHPTQAGGWAGCALSVPNGNDNIGDEEGLLGSSQRKTALGPALTPSQQDLLRGSLKQAAEDLMMNEGRLNTLDSGCGDGDCGNTLKKFAQAILAYIGTSSLEYPSTVLWDLSEIAESDMGGTSGGIYSLGLSAASQAVASAKSLDLTTWASALDRSMEAIMKYGGAMPGDRTMLDALHPALVAIKANASTDLKTALQKTMTALEEGTKKTARMVASAGRAAYVSLRYAHDEDAGARAVAIWLAAVLKYVAESR